MLNQNCSLMLSAQRAYPIALILVLVCASAFTETPATSSARELLEVSLKSNRLPERYSYHLQTKLQNVDYDLSHKDADWVDGEIDICNVFRDGQRFDSASLTYVIKGATSRPDTAFRVIWNGEQRLARQQDVGGPAAGLIVTFSKDPKAAAHLETDYSYARYLDGWIWGDDEPMAMILEGAGTAVISGHESIGNIACTVVEGDVPKRGHYKLWLDESSGYCVRKATVRRMPGDQEFGTAMESGRQVECSIDGVDIEKLGDYFVGMSGKETVVILKNGKRTVGENLSAERSRFKINPDFKAAKAFQMQNIPEGTSVRTDDPKDHFAYIWRNGEVVRNDDSTVVGQINQIVQGERNAASKP